mgnify:CR=1 FL=1
MAALVAACGGDSTPLAVDPGDPVAPALRCEPATAPAPIDPVRRDPPPVGGSCDPAPEGQLDHEFAAPRWHLGSSTRVETVLRHRDGWLVFVRAGSGHYLARFGADGRRDRSFGQDGFVGDLPAAVPVIWNDEIVLVDRSRHYTLGPVLILTFVEDDGRVRSESYGEVLRRCGREGSEGGLFVASATVGRGGRLLIGGVAGGAGCTRPMQPVVLRLTSKGLDPTFAAGGVAALPNRARDRTVGGVRTAGSETITSLRTDAAGRVLGALVVSPEQEDLHLFRLTEVGRLDACFGHRGFLHRDLPIEASDAELGSVLVDGDHLVVGGSAVVDGESRVLIARVSSDGQLDADFGEGGVVTLAGRATATGSRTFRLWSLVTDGGGGVFALGSAGTDPRDGWLLAHLDRSGLDSDFGLDGTLTLRTGERTEGAKAGLLDGCGGLVFAGDFEFEPGSARSRREVVMERLRPLR